MRTVFPWALALSPSLVLGACDGPRDTREPFGSASAALVEGPPPSRVIVWGDTPSDLGLRAAVTERAALGATAIGLGPAGLVLVLDAVHERVVSVDDGGKLVPRAKVSKDADDLAVAPDGALAIHHSTSTKIEIFDAAGRRIGDVDSSLVRDVDGLSLGPSRQVRVNNAYQETYLLGSPAVPSMQAATIHSKREGSAFLPDGSGLTVVRSDDGSVEMRVLSAVKKDLSNDIGRGSVRMAIPLGQATSGRIVGVSGNVACLRIEHVDAASPSLAVRREVACVDAVRGKEVLRVDLPAAGLYVPRRELAFAAGKLVHMHPEKDGMRLSTWTVPSTMEEGAR